MAKTITPIVVEKEDVAGLHFPQGEVLHSADDIKLRRSALERATTLGNIEHNKCRILFEDDQGLKQVNTTIWATTEHSIILKKGVIIPISRIHKVMS